MLDFILAPTHHSEPIRSDQWDNSETEPSVNWPSLAPAPSEPLAESHLGAGIKKRAGSE